MSRENFIVRVSRNRRSALSNSADAIAFSSENKSVKINLRRNPRHSDILSYTFLSEPAAGTTNLIKLEHGYDFTPALMSMATVPALNSGSSSRKTFYKVPVTTSFDGGTGSASIYEAYTDRRYIYFDIRRTGSVWTAVMGTTIFFKYNILDVVGME